MSIIVRVWKKSGLIITAPHCSSITKKKHFYFTSMGLEVESSSFSNKSLFLVCICRTFRSSNSINVVFCVSTFSFILSSICADFRSIRRALFVRCSVASFTRASVASNVFFKVLAVPLVPGVAGGLSRCFLSSSPSSEMDLSASPIRAFQRASFSTHVSSRSFSSVSSLSHLKLE